MHDTRTLHPRHGTHNPTPATPERRAGSIRRTTTVDLLRPDGVMGPVIVDARGRDLVTPASGRPEAVAGSRIRGRVDYPAGSLLREIETEPARPAAQQLIGAAVASGFRAKAVQALPDEAAQRTLLHLLLDDLPGAVLVSGYALHETVHRVDIRIDPERARAVTAGRIDLCAGFARDATMLTELAGTGIMPQPTGPIAPLLDPGTDPDAWHDHDVLPAGGIRRLRRLDLVPEAGGLRVDGMFRDSFVDSAGLETVIHEYTMDVRIDPADLRITAIEAEPRVPPWVECPAAAASARRLAGQTVADMRTWVRKQLTGTSTCTHLNDLLRSLTDVDHLVTLLDDHPGDQDKTPETPPNWS